MTGKIKKHTLLLIIGSLIFVISLATGFVVNNVLDSPELCGSCHEMQPYYSSYLNPQNGSLIASHQLNCIQCHANSSIYDAKKQVATEMLVRKLNLSTSFTSVMNLKPDCSKCHLPPADSIHKTINLTECTYCHPAHKSSVSWINESLPSIPYGPHKNQTCVKCHGTEFRIPRCINCHSGHGGQKLENSQCLVCHVNPHVPKIPGILPGNTVKFTGNLSFSVCQPCHENEYFYMTTIPTRHTDMGTCTKCHQSHGEKPKCTDCHDAMKVKKHFEGLLKCTDCHKPSGRPLCEDCHGRTHGWSVRTAIIKS